MMVANSALIESTALNTEAIASGCLNVLSVTPATKASVFLPTFVLVMSILSGMFDLRRVKLPDLNLIIFPLSGTKSRQIRKLNISKDISTDDNIFSPIPLFINWSLFHD
ncbi:hypothetical protein RchiOBHm_Chr3g0454441 [Rosa chinensis]|uniref:Uncharacterized protein n=1 Tax=Rosa chinensis TaxID=74649 RepID=A0A2P6R6U1_ROSCH|nr:hypothetical protein RchiOBHm_Chr3g0454441 [Rosa chinensis]